MMRRYIIIIFNYALLFQLEEEKEEEEGGERKGSRSGRTKLSRINKLSFTG